MLTGRPHAPHTPASLGATRSAESDSWAVADLWAHALSWAVSSDSLLKLPGWHYFAAPRWLLFGAPAPNCQCAAHQRWDQGTAKAGASDISPPPKFIVTDVKRAQSVLVVCELLGGDLFGSLQRSSDFAWAGPSSIRASNIRAIVIMTSAVETSRISGLSLKLADTTTSSQLY